MTRLTVEDAKFGAQLEDDAVFRSPEVDRFSPRLVDGQAEDAASFGVEERDGGTAIALYIYLYIYNINK